MVLQTIKDCCFGYSFDDVIPLIVMIGRSIDGRLKSYV
jgi:hypothetical protein